MFEPFSLDQLTMFVAVVDHGGFSAAARQLGRVQSAVSHAVASLETALSTKLFDRSHRPPSPTLAGRRLAAEARLVLAQVRELRQVAGVMSEGLEAELTLVVDQIYPVGTLTRALSDFHRRFPTVTLRVQTELLDGAVAMVREGLADFGVCNLADQHDPELDELPVGRVALIPVCAPQHPLAEESSPQRTDRLKQHVQVVLSERAVQTADRGVLAARTWRVTDMSTKLQLLLAGVGWGSLPRELCEGPLARGELARLHPEPWLGGQHEVVLHTVVRADRPLGPAGHWLRMQLTLDGAHQGCGSPT